MIKKICCLAFLCLFAGCTFAQIEGNVFDQKEKGIVNAVVTISDSTGKIMDTDTSDNRGFYSLKGLKPGKYKIETKAAGFSVSVKRNIEVPKEAEAANDGYDTYFAIRLDIILTAATPVKN